MKKLMCTGAAIFVLLSATLALAADVTGAWTGQVAGPNGEGFQLTFTFKQDGAKLTGTIAVPQGPPLDISNGKMDGDKISFDVVFNGTTIKHDGVVAGDEIKLNTKSDDPNFPASTLTLTRVK